MKAVILADSHTDVPTMQAVVRLEQPDIILHLGDHIADGLELQKSINIRVCLVKGNTDQESEGEEEQLISLENTRVFMTHGHLYKVEDGLAELCDAGARNHANIVLFGHTHRPFLSYIDGIWYMNPGRIGRKSSKKIHATYGVVSIVDNRIKCEISEVSHSL